VKMRKDNGKNKKKKKKKKKKRESKSKFYEKYFKKKMNFLFRKVALYEMSSSSSIFNNFLSFFM
jgi:hypothetical protein